MEGEGEREGKWTDTAGYGDRASSEQQRGSTWEDQAGFTVKLDEVFPVDDGS